MRLAHVAGSLAGVWQKWERARLHYRTLAAQIDSNNYPITAKAHGDGLEYVFHLGEIEPFDPLPWALGAGDCLFNLRAALDHLVYQLHVRRYGGRDVPPGAAKDSAFPILDQPHVDRKGQPIPTCKWPKIKRLGFPIRRAIEFLQPYKTRNDKFHRVRRRLLDLDYLNNIDKHRHLHVVELPITEMLAPRFPPQYGFRFEPFWVPLKTDAKVCRWTFSTPPPDIARHVQMQNYVVAEVTLDERGSRFKLLPYLQDLSDAVETVIKRFELFLPS